MKVALINDTTHNPLDESHRVSCLRENLTSSSDGEGLETGRVSTPVPRQSFTRQLLFKELKGTYRIDEVPSRRRWVVEALIYAALLTWMASRQLLYAVHAKLAFPLQGRLPLRRFARVLLSIAHDILLIMARPPRKTRMLVRDVSRLLLHESPDPNRNRPSLISAIEMRRHAYRHKHA